MMEKKIVLMIKNLETEQMICRNSQWFVRKNTMFLTYDLAFLLIKSKKKLQS